MHTKLTDVFSQSDFQPIMQVRQGAKLAYVVRYDETHSVAFAPHVSQQFIDCPPIRRIPQSTACAYGMIAWKKHWIPLIDLQQLFSATDVVIPAGQKPPFVLVLAYQSPSSDNSKQSLIRFAAIALKHIPESVYVRDSDFCGLPKDNPIISQLAVSAFLYHHQPTPIISTNRLFTIQAH